MEEEIIQSFNSFLTTIFKRFDLFYLIDTNIFPQIAGKIFCRGKEFWNKFFAHVEFRDWVNSAYHYYIFSIIVEFLIAFQREDGIDEIARRILRCIDKEHSLYIHCHGANGWDGKYDVIYRVNTDYEYNGMVRSNIPFYPSRTIM